jgi:hypothetical protein
MIKRIIEKIFGLEPDTCPVCEVLREQLHKSEVERKELLSRALAPPSQPVEVESKEEYKAITPQFIPWRVKQQMLEAEDRKQAELLRKKAQEIQELEMEMGISHGDAGALGENK